MRDSETFRQKVRYTSLDACQLHEKFIEAKTAFSKRSLFKPQSWSTATGRNYRFALSQVSIQ